MWVVVKIRVPLLGTLNNRCRSRIGTQNGTIILTTTHGRTGRIGVSSSRCLREADDRPIEPIRPFIGTFRGVGGSGVGGLNAYNKDPIRPYLRKYSPLPPSPLPPLRVLMSHVQLVMLKQHAARSKEPLLGGPRNSAMRNVGLIKLTDFGLHCSQNASIIPESATCTGA